MPTRQRVITRKILRKAPLAEPVVVKRDRLGANWQAALVLVVSVLFTMAAIWAGDQNDGSLAGRITKLELDNQLQQEIITDLGDKVYGLENR
jgi:hypothetical protein